MRGTEYKHVYVLRNKDTGNLDNIVYNKSANGEITLTEYIKYQNRDKMINYEKKYNEALGWMQSLYKGLHGITKEDAEHYFPELKESEDERIRKAIIAYISHGQHCGVSNADMITWLEKQGEEKALNANEVIEWLVANICDFEYYVKRFKEDFEL